MSLNQFFSILKVRWLLVAACLSIALAIAYGLTSVLPPKYTATSQVVINGTGSDPIGGFAVPPQLMPGFMATQVDIATSRAVASQVVSDLGLDKVPENEARWRTATGGSGTLHDWLVAEVQKGVQVKPLRESSLLTVAYSSNDPQLAARIANGFAHAYLDVSVRMRVEPAQQASAFLDRQAEQLRDRLEAAQARLSQYQKDHQITSTDERLDVETARLQELSSQLTALQATLVDGSLRRDVARTSLNRGGLADVPEVLQSTLIQGLKRDQAALESRLEEQSAILGESHPTIIRLRSELEATRAKVERESAFVVSSLSKSSTVVIRREAELRDALEQQRAKVLQIRQSRDELALLQRDVEDIQRSYASVTGKREQSNLESKARQSGAYLLSEAVVPMRPSSPNLAINLAAALVLGGGVGVWSAIGLEMKRRRIRSVDDLANSVDRPMIAIIRRLPRRMLAKPAVVPAADLVLSPPTMLAPPSTRPAGGEQPSASSTGGAGDAIVVHKRLRKPIGQILRDAGVLREDDCDKVLKLAAASNLRFGEAAVAAGLVKKTHVKQALAYQFDYPVILPGKSEVSREVIAAYESGGVVSDIRKLRTQVLARWIQPASDASDVSRKAFSIVSPSRGDGKSFVASNLAVTFSQMRMRTLLIDGDLRTGRVDQLFGLSNRIGLSSVLNNGDVEGAIQRVAGLRYLAVITAGGEAPNPSDLLSLERLEHLMRQLEQVFDVIIIDTPNTVEDPDAEVISVCAKGCVMVGRLNHTDYDSMNALADEVSAMGVTIIGTTFVQA